MTSASVLHTLIHAPEIVVMPGLFDAFSANSPNRRGLPPCNAAAQPSQEYISAAPTTP